MSDNEEVVQEENEYQSTSNEDNDNLGNEVDDEEEANDDKEEQNDNEEENNDNEEEQNDDEEENNDNDDEEQNDEENNNENDDEEEDNEDDDEEQNDEENNNENDDEEEDNEDDDEDEPEMSEEECIKYFKESVKEYLKLEEEIKTLDKASKVRKEKRKNIGDSILSFIQQKDISHVKLQGNYKGKQIENHNTVKKSNVSFKTVTSIIFEHFDNIDDAKNLMDKINDQRVETNVSRLRIAKDKKKKTNAFKLQNLVNNNTIKSDLSEQVPEHMQYLYTTTVQNE